MLNEKLKNYDLILASASPRRQHLLEEMGIRFTVLTKPTDELYPNDLTPLEVAEFLSRLKADAFSEADFNASTLIITADTVVTIEGKILGKPTDEKEAIEMLEHLSGKTHEVITGVTLRTLIKEHTFSVLTQVVFKKLNAEEINYYINNFKPYDKAGAYGIQEWIGHVAIEKIEGSYFNVMGLPTHRLYEELSKFV